MAKACATCSQFRTVHAALAVFPDPSASEVQQGRRVGCCLRPTVEDFNAVRLEKILHGRRPILTADESMSSHRHRKDATGGLPNVSYIYRKPKPLGTEFKAVADAETEVMHMEIQKGKDPMRKKPFSNELGVCTGCTVRLTEAVCATEEKRCMLGDSWFGSVNVRPVPDYELCNFECSVSNAVV